MKQENKLVAANIAMMFALVATVAVTCCFAFLHEKESYNRTFEVSLLNGYLDIIEGRTDAKTELYDLIEKSDKEMLDEQSTDRLGFIMDELNKR